MYQEVTSAQPQPLTRRQRIWVVLALIGLAMTSSAPTTLAWMIP